MLMKLVKLHSTRYLFFFFVKKAQHSGINSHTLAWKLPSYSFPELTTSNKLHCHLYASAC